MRVDVHFDINVYGGWSTNLSVFLKRSLLSYGTLRYTLYSKMITVALPVIIQLLIY